jgi:hypothetical protein
LLSADLWSGYAALFRHGFWVSLVHFANL